MKSKYAGKCTKCNLDWNVDDEIFISKSSDDNSWIKCKDKECFESQGGKIEAKKSGSGGGGRPFVSQKFPITEAINIYKLSEELLESFKNKRKDSDEKLTIGEELQAIESFMKTLSGSFKP